MVYKRQMIRLLRDKKYKKTFERWFGRQWFKLIKLVCRFLTLERVRAFGRITGSLGFYLILRHRRQALHNIKLIYGKEKSKKELWEIIHRTFINASCFGWELLYLWAQVSSGKQAEDLINKVEGLEYLTKAYARGKGVIGLGAHLGNFTLLGRKLDMLGITNTTIMRQMRDGKLEEMFRTMRGEFGHKSIPKFPVSKAIKACIEWLKQGKLLLIFVDQRSGRGVKVDFMGVSTPTPTGAAAFALKTGAAVLPIVNIRDKADSYKLIIGPEVTLTKTGNYKEDVLVNTERFNKVIEKYIRLYPDQWFWFHNRWKGITINES